MVGRPEAGDKEGIDWLSQECLEKRAFTIAFNCFFLTRQVDRCVETLIQTKNFPEAAFFAKSYCPSHISRVVQMWKESLAKTHPIICTQD